MPTSLASPTSGRPLDACTLRPLRARIAFSDSAAKQLENITGEAELHVRAGSNSEAGVSAWP
ncbi:hypothetical protein [Streptomyces griseorubiginosus]|uniref:hypothetical protein n=1 Tax=Streptomyces griseorubiginosus TaxID=67304 RepID=UPI000AACC1EB|nr:hypothetical protein [Streptomyces griseorubiginosus]